MDRVVCLESTDGGTQTSALGADRFRQLEPRQKLALTVTPKHTTHERSNWPSSCVRVGEVRSWFRGTTFCGQTQACICTALGATVDPTQNARSWLCTAREYLRLWSFGLFACASFCFSRTAHANCTCEQVEMDYWHAKNHVRAPARERANGSASSPAIPEFDFAASLAGLGTIFRATRPQNFRNA